MYATNDSSRLRRVLLLDGAMCLLMGVLLALWASPLARLTDMPEELLFYAGIALLPIAAFIVGVALRETSSTWGVRLVIAGNMLWVAGSLWVMLGGAIEANALGLAFVGVQAAAVALLAVLEHRLSSRRSRDRSFAVAGSSK